MDVKEFVHNLLGHLRPKPPASKPAKPTRAKPVKPKPVAPAPAAAPKPAPAPVLHGRPSGPPRGDPWYGDTAQDRQVRSGGGGGSRPWIPDRPDWFQPGNGRRGQIQTAEIIGSNGEVRHVPPPDYTPRPLDQ
jgi:hypothetical protein